MKGLGDMPYNHYLSFSLAVLDDWVDTIQELVVEF